MALYQTKIADGICLHYYETSRFKSNYLCVNFLTPLSEDTVAQNALIPEVLSKATAAYPTIASISNRLADLYGTSLEVGCEKRGDNQCVYFALDFLGNGYVPEEMDLLSQALAFLRELLFAPLLENGVFSNRIVETEKEKQIAEIESLIGNKRAYAATRLIDEMCKNERYHIRACGTAAQVRTITPSSLYERYQALLANAQVEIFLIGKAEIDTVKTQLAQMFSATPRRPIPLSKTEVIARATEQRTVVEEQTAQQSNLQIGFRGVPPRGDLKKSAAFSVFCDLFGGSPTSKLFMNVREKLSLCYFCRAGAIYEKGILTIQAGIAAENLELCQKEMFYQLSLCQSGEISEEEISMAKRSLKNAYLALQDRPTSIERYYLNALIGNNPYDFTDYIPAIEAVTKAEIVEAANAISLDTLYFLKGVSAKGAEQ